MKIIKSFIKGIFIAGFIISIVLIFNRKESNQTSLFTKEIIKGISEAPLDTSYYFLGSSRVQRSIDPILMSKKSKKENVYNLGISGSTFLNNCILADYLIRSNKKKKIFIELSPIIPSLKPGLLNFADASSLNPFRSILRLQRKESYLDQAMFQLKLYNDYLFSKINIKEGLKKHIPGLSKKISHQIGYSEDTKKGAKSITSFITYKEINIQHKSKINLNKYHNYIEHLDSLAARHQTKIVFFLPITYKSPKEKDIVIPLFQSLRSNQKLAYSKHFISTITNSDYLLDINHFNKFGAETYTSLLSTLIEK